MPRLTQCDFCHDKSAQRGNGACIILVYVLIPSPALSDAFCNFRRKPKPTVCLEEQTTGASLELYREASYLLFIIHFALL